MKFCKEGKGCSNLWKKGGIYIFLIKRRFYAGRVNIWAKSGLTTVSTRPATVRIFNHILLAKSLLIVSHLAYPQAAEPQAFEEHPF
jgi:hypothetical protein